MPRGHRSPDVLTTTEAAALLYCAPSQIVKCCDRGHLPFFLVPGGSGHRRIRLADLAAFARRENVPLDRIEAHQQRCEERRKGVA